MTPDQHRARAKELTEAADGLYRTIVEGEMPVDAFADRRLTVTIALAQLHATLALGPASGWPSPVPADEVVDYGDGFP
ncbi:hypothetical protein [Actinoplanes sp. NPDC023714]|uniref:hypothetical protein n=1 Tax=Actinoplanes sp. NPDC023714 TaxID=3154322 RepID=UPI0033ECA718